MPDPGRSAGGPLRPRLLLVLAGTGFLTWLALIHGAVPWLIRIVYEGRGPAVLNRLISGQAVHPVERYLGVWNGVAWKLDIVVLLLLLLWFPGGPVRRFASRVVRADPVLGAGGLLATAAFWGLATGVAEGIHVMLRKTILPLNSATFNQSIEAVWMVPIVELPLFLALGVLLVVVARAWRRPVSLKVATVLFAFLGAYALARSARLGLSVWAIRLLVLGIAVQTARWLAPRASAFKRRLPGLIAACMAWTVLSASLLHGGRAAREWWTVRGLPAADDGAPNVLLLILDTVRAQSLGLYGHEHPTTPELEELAESGTVFTQAVSVTSWTLPAHASMLTGYSPWDLSVGWKAPLDDEKAILAEALNDRGYRTGAFVANRFYAGRESGIARGFARFEEEGLSFRWAIANSWLGKAVVAFVRRRLDLAPPSTDMDAEDVSDRFLRWSAQRSNRPWFALLNYMDAHTPYVAPDSILTRFTSGGPRREPSGGTVYTEAELEEFRANYDAAIAFIDQEIGRIVDSLDVRGELDRTLLIVASDHGEHIGEHDPGLHIHGNSLYAATIQVPLLIRFPGAVPRGLRVESTVGIRRIAATVMDLAAAGTGPFPGPSLAVEFDATQAAVESPVLSFIRPGYATRNSEPLAAGTMASATWKQWHYIRNGDGKEELYDVVADPWETADRVTDPELADILGRLRSEVDALERFGAAPRR